ncbi:hypothetical protein KY290_025300 [Solanum tuberosum]|uniref:Uncharacterized protein n=1 Tax=Solanum tuberosum TaxID=4113 RepID=A0ABQ7UT76_SOLTU|nr:hypothetical protein KY290_025300 [Solanum tuberosum]
MQMNFATIDHDVDVPVVEVGKQKGSEENVAKKDDTSIKEHAMEESTGLLPTTHYSDPSKNVIFHDKKVDDGSDTIQQDVEKHASNPVVVDTSDSTTSDSISFRTEAAKDAPVYGLPN